MSVNHEDMLMSLNNFRTPRIIDGQHCVNLKVMRLILLEPGTHPDFPEKGFGLVSRYRYVMQDGLGNMAEELRNHMNQWLPDIRDVNVNMELKNGILYLGITCDDVYYEYTFNGSILKPVTLNSIIEEGVK